MRKIAITLIYSVLILLAFNGQIFSGEKGYSKNNTKPFAEKVKRHQTKLTAKSRAAFNKEINELSSKTQSHREAIKLGAKGHGWSEQAANLEAVSGNTVNMKWNNKAQVPLFIDGQRLLDSKFSASGNVELAAQEFFNQNNELLKIESPGEEFQLTENSQDKYGMVHLRYQQMYQGLEVWARDVRVHFNREGELSAFNGRYIPTPVYLKPANVSLTEMDAIQIATQKFGQQPQETNARKLIYVDENERGVVTWLVQIKRGLAENRHYFVDAQSGEILKAYNHVMADGPVTGSGVDLLNATRNLNVYQIGNEFALIDASKPMFNAGSSTLPQSGKGVIYVLDAKNADSTLFFVGSNNANSWSDRAGVSASANGGLVYDFFATNFSRDAIDGNGSTMNIIINFKENFNNAFWNGQFMVFGNGDGQAFGNLAASLDVTAHEMSHGVIERTANLVYENQPGALNESFSDVFGVLCDFWVKGENGNWLLGEEVTTPLIAGDALRNMEDPGAANVAFNGQQPTKMSEFRTLPNTEQGDNGGVHINSGIPNRAFFLFATNPAVGRDKAGAVYYRALTTYLSRNSQFIDCRLGVIKAAEDIHGAGSAEATAAAQAFDTVEVFDGNNTPPPPVIPPVAGDEFVVVISTDDGLLYRLNPATDEFAQITSVPVASRPSVTDDGQFILYVDQTNNVHAIGSDGSNDQQLTDSGGFSNVAISPSGQFLAATTTFSEPTIFIFDLDGSGQGVPFELFNPTTAQGESDANILFPDRIDWASDSDILMYDALNIEVSAAGDTTDYWDINLLQASTGGIARLLPPQPTGVSVGNPVFASNTDNIIAIDFIDENGEVSVFGINLNSNDVAKITFNFNSPGSPAFSSDDSKVYYHFRNQDDAALWVVDLAADGITGAGNDQGLFSSLVFPVAFAVGQRFPTSVESENASVPESFNLAQNYPNPFNPETAIRYELPINADVSLSIYDISGRLVSVLENEKKTAGQYTSIWTGRNEKGTRVASGIYFYRLEIKDASGKASTLTRKMTLLK